MNVPVTFMRTNLLRYWESYFLKKPFRPVVHVMWTIGIAGAWYEGIHHRHLEKLHTEAAEVKRLELKDKHTLGESRISLSSLPSLPSCPRRSPVHGFVRSFPSSLTPAFSRLSFAVSALKALEDQDKQLAEAEEFIRISKTAIQGATLHIEELKKQKAGLTKAATEAKAAYENYKPQPFGH